MSSWNINGRHFLCCFAGKGGSNVNRLKEETGVTINIPDEKSSTIRIEGSPEGVARAQAELSEMVTKMENEREKDIVIEHRFHKNIIGAKGEKIREIREKCNQVTWPNAARSLVFGSCPLSLNWRFKWRSPIRLKRATWSRFVARNRMSMPLTSTCKSSTKSCSRLPTLSRWAVVLFDFLEKLSCFLSHLPWLHVHRTIQQNVQVLTGSADNETDDKIWNHESTIAVVFVIKIDQYGWCIHFYTDQQLHVQLYNFVT